MKIFKKISGTYAKILSDDTFTRVCELSGQKRKLEGHRSLGEIEMEEGDARLLEIEMLLKNSGVVARPRTLATPLDTDLHFKEKHKYYDYRFRRNYEQNDLDSFLFGVIVCFIGLMDSNEMSVDLMFEELMGVGPLMNTDTGKIVVDQGLNIKLKGLLGEDANYADVRIKRVHSGLDEAGYAWINPLRHMPPISIIKNKFYDFSGLPCSYENPKGFAILTDNFDFPEIVYDSHVLQSGDCGCKIMSTKEHFGFHVRGPYTLWNTQMIRELYRLGLEFRWYPIHFR